MTPEIHMILSAREKMYQFVGVVGTTAVLWSGASHLLNDLWSIGVQTPTCRECFNPTIDKFKFGLSSSYSQNQLSNSLTDCH